METEYTQQSIIEYAQLAQQCYNVPNETHQLPKDWEVIFAPENQGTWDTFYALYVNTVKKEVVLGIRGTDKLLNILTDTGLFVAVLKGKPIKPPDTSQVENLAKYIHHFNLNISAEELHQLGQEIKEFDKGVGTSINNWVLVLLYIAAISTGLFASNLLANPSIVLGVITAGTMASLSVSALMKLKKDTHDKLIKKLESPECRKLIEALGKSLVSFKRHFPNFDFKIVGHSLGGIIAELCAVKIGVECITFESPGALEILEQLSEYKDKPRKIVNYLSAPNIVNTLNHHPGTTYRIILPHTVGFSPIHAVNCVVQSASRVLTYASFGTVAAGKVFAVKGAVTVGKKVGLSALGTKLAGGIAGLWRDFNWVKKQHSIDNIVIYLQSSDNPQLVKMESWPWVYWKRNILKELARDFVPLQKDKAGIRNLMDEEGMREAQIKRIPEYKEA
ncbi:hypothetical protein RhiirA5_407006 [Rhizophagus irregularis]|uniref:Uncharacterized protein n=1 Tax=Rhizophagus irregularis TaxID=588596 RepID=A0A2I1FBP5_9GLOM|nr:hypothetical protein RhiirA5_407006 [Rhizophagus irregularis]PKC56957.1 hypothetical protein RhiirA1_446365 [Rhizophagus irregularis]PKY31814.1 hypothetical protein RhiirB3_490151 [Rhizophagus irregularis]CAB4473519.1 unnamed protein product [Rhizophagus irregularis]CAB5384700.1 unnamed protein product [Rhizophagus irregularis]